MNLRVQHATTSDYSVFVQSSTVITSIKSSMPNGNAYETTNNRTESENDGRVSSICRLSSKREEGVTYD